MALTWPCTSWIIETWLRRLIDKGKCPKCPGGRLFLDHIGRGIFKCDICNHTRKETELVYDAEYDMHFIHPRSKEFR